MAKIKSIEVIPWDLFFNQRWEFALGSMNKMSGCFVKIQNDDGLEGYGYANAVPHMGETTGGIISAIHFLEALLIGSDPTNINELEMKISTKLYKNHRAKCAVEMALYDLAGKMLNLPVYKLLGGKFREEIDVIRIVPLDQIGPTLSFCEKLRESGFKYFKIKFNGHFQEDLQRVKRIREEFGPDIGLTVDANQAYDVKSMLKLIKHIEPYGVDIIEQPVLRSDIKSLNSITKNSSIWIEADEAADDLNQLLLLTANKYVDGITIKTPKLGGLHAAKIAANICKVANTNCRFGTAFGSQLYAAMDIHLICSIPNIYYACEVGEFLNLSNDPVDGIEIIDGKLKIPQGPGYGVTVAI